MRPEARRTMSEPTVITTPHGDIVLPHPSKLPAGVIRRARKTEDPVDQFFNIIEGLFPEGSRELEIVDSIPVDELPDIFAEWLQGASVGESSGSSTSASDESQN